jgi:hypothetical protein
MHINHPVPNRLTRAPDLVARLRLSKLPANLGVPGV